VTTLVVPDCAEPVASHEAGADSPTLTFGVIGRLAPQKGQREFLEAFAAAFRGAPSTRARVVGGALFGEDDYAASLLVLAAELGIADQVDFVGFVPDVAAEFARLDVLVAPSLVPEGFGLTVVEGMAAGLPVVASAAGGPVEILTDGVDGVLVPPADVAALAHALRRLAEDAPARGRLGAAARRRATQFTPERSAALLANALRTAVRVRAS
jgi:glycosyltransferase involved in cell wall biosynthesis